MAVVEAGLARSMKGTFSCVPSLNKIVYLASSSGAKSPTLVLDETVDDQRAGMVWTVPRREGWSSRSMETIVPGEMVPE